MHIQTLPLSQALHVLHVRWNLAVVAASMVFGFVVASPWMGMAMKDPYAWIVVALVTLVAGGLFKGTALLLVRWARHQEYKNWARWCQGPRASTVVAQVHQQRRARETLELAWQRDVQAMAGARLTWSGTWLRQGDMPAVHEMTAGEVRVLRRQLQRAGLPCHTWQSGGRAARLARRQKAEDVSARWIRRFGSTQE